MPKNNLNFLNYACEYPIIPELFFQKCLPIILKNYAGIIGAGLTIKGETTKITTVLAIPLMFCISYYYGIG